MKPSTETVWNAILATIGIAVVATIGYLYTENTALKERLTRLESTIFTSKEAEGLSVKITDVMTDVDKRLAVMETNVQWSKVVTMLCAKPNDIDTYTPPAPMAPAPPADPPKAEPMESSSIPMPSESIPQSQSRRYDVRQSKD